MEPETIGLIVTAVVTAASALSALVPSVGRVMRIVDVIALNFLKARNDPNAQGKTK